jgi:hypothetical protein
MISHPLALQEADQEMRLMARPNLGRRLGNGRSTVDTVFHHVLDALGDVKETLLETLALGEHVTSGGVHGLAKCM